jgi:tRNA(Arg) A34 adenosine deaminase TadA
MLDKAINIAKQVQNKKQNICAIITDRRLNILSIGVNSYSKTSPLQKFYADRVGEVHKIFNHAEIDCIKKLPHHSKPENIFIARISKSGKSLPAFPCRICQEALKDLGIKAIITT